MSTEPPQPDPQQPEATSKTGKSKRSDAQRNEQALLSVAASLFVTSGVNVPVRDIAAKAGVGTGTIYRHFPTRSDLIIAVYRHQVEACAEAGPALLKSAPSPYVALQQWTDLFVDFLKTKFGLAHVLQAGDPTYEALQAYLFERLAPVCQDLLEAARASGEVQSDIHPKPFMRGVGGLCIGAARDPNDDAKQLVRLLIAGLRQPLS
ncbi:TetR/AcrR family transcriptional regulator [Deinococcus roseus]|uniref:TetR family transcriptional regulator n=1 Tax=Deinococcus roseus TaxID=392414 RepID=A0ABQ2DDE0_9DEIO|nr:TetR/AcrR family transcriptional regulator [Deinococcus roseus]GGJ54396.1 TetR family transcriptional regulator [Deinococcus roseus]